MWESQAAFWPDFSKPRWEATGLVAFLGGVISIAGWPSDWVATNQMWTKGNRERLIQMFMHGDPAARQGASQFRAFQLPHLVSKADRIISSHHALMLQGKNQVRRKELGPGFLAAT